MSRGRAARVVSHCALLAWALALHGCERVGPAGVSHRTEPPFVWGLCNPADPNEVRDLAGGRPFLVRLTCPFTGGAPVLRSLRAVQEMVVHPDVRVMVALPYRPRQRATPEDWVGYVERAVAYYAQLPSVRYLQITQSINSPLYADPFGDNAEHGFQALVQGLRAADQARRATRADLRLGFSVYAGTGATPEQVLRRLAAYPDVVESVDWVGVDCYPGSGLWCREQAAGAEVVEMLRRMREEWLPLAGLEAAPLVLTQVGVATVLHVSPERQGAWLEAITRAVWERHDELGLVGSCWFEARDRDSGAGLFRDPRAHVADHFGLSTSLGWRKSGFAAYAASVATRQPPATARVIE